MVTEYITRILTYILDWMRSTTITIDTYSFTVMDVSIWLLLALLVVSIIYAIFGDY